MSSLRRRLLVPLWLALAAVGLVSAAFSYFQTRAEAHSLLDYQIEQIAQFVAAQPFADPATPAAALRPLLDLDHDAEDDFVVTVRDAAGRVLYASRPDAPLPMPDWLGFRTLPFNGGRYRAFSAEAGARRVVVAQQTEARREAAADAVLSALLPVGLMLPALGLVIGVVIRRQLRPLEATAAEVARRPPLALAPLPSQGLPDEIRPLIEELNRLLARQRAALEHERRFIADAAHALRTPLTALQLQSDVLEGARDRAENAARRAELRAGIRRVAQLADQLLALARNEPGAAPVAGRESLDEAAARACDLYRPVAAARGVRLELVAGADVLVAGQMRELALLVGNLLDNACRYTPAGGCVRVSTQADTNGARLEVLDEGPGVPPAELERVFERFHRVPGDDTEGSGLGLAVVRSVADRLGARVQLRNRTDRSGLVASVWFPRSAAVASVVPAGIQA